MAEDWAADVRAHVSDPNEKAIAGIVRYCGIALHKRDSSLVSFSSKDEVERVRANFLRKKLGLTNPDAELDQAATVSYSSDAPLTCQFWVEDHPLKHSFHHLARIKAAVEKARVA